MMFIKSLFLAFSMFSCIPVPNVAWSKKNMRYLMVAFPFVGVVISLLCAFWLFFAFKIAAAWQGNFSLHFWALGLTLIPIFLTGGIHVDGFMDTCDALASHAPREKKLEILKDSHSGAFAVLGCVLYFLSFYVLSYEFTAKCAVLSLEMLKKSEFVRLILPFLSVFVISRLFSALAVSVFPIAKNSGLVHTFSSNGARLFTAVWCEFWLCAISLALIYFCGRRGMLPVMTSLLVFIWYFFMAKRNFGGITGDTAGFFVQICEIFGLLGIVIVMN